MSFHFVEDYERHVARLMAEHPLDQAMQLAVGGDYRDGALQAEFLMRHCGLADDMSVFELGCGSGRLAHALGNRLKLRRYLGVDVVQALLDYAATRAPADYLFRLNRSYDLPLAPGSWTFATAFSVFTHLHTPEVYIYLLAIYKALRPGGRLVFSFLELEQEYHWRVFMGTCRLIYEDRLPHVNTFLHRGTLVTMLEKMGFEPVFYDGGDPRIGIAQSICVATKRRAPAV